MIDSWVWVLLWLFLVAATALFLVVCALRLYHGAMRLLDEVGDATERLQLGDFDHAPDSSDPERPGVGVAAVFRAPAEAMREYDAGKSVRRARRRVRRVEGKRVRSQPQRIRDVLQP